MKRLSLVLLCAFLIHTIAGGQTEPEYRLGAEDRVQLQVWSRADLSLEVALDLDGNIQLPLLGTVPVAGLTSTELGDLVRRRYSILDPNISEVLVTVLEYNSQRVLLVGEVITPGRQTFRSIPNLWEVILQAGGATTTADLARVQVVRKDPEEGEAPSITVDLSRGVEGTDMASLPKLRPRDTIIIPSLVSNAVAGTTFQVLGSVRNPGIYRVTAAETVLEALALSGGPLPNADLRKVRLTRPTPDGLVAYRLDIEGHLTKGSPSVDLPLKPGDTIMIPEGGGVSVGSIFGSFLRFTSIITAVSSLIVALNR